MSDETSETAQSGNLDVGNPDGGNRHSGDVVSPVAGSDLAGLPAEPWMEESQVSSPFPPERKPLPTGTWKPDPDGDGEHYWQDLEPRPGDLAAERYIGHKHADGTWKPITGGPSEPPQKQVSKPRKSRRSPASNVVNFPLPTSEQAKKTSPLLTGEQKKSKRGKQKTSSPLLTGEQVEDLKSFLPSLDSGFWWEAPADAKGFKIKLRWRDADKKQQCYVFRRLGKFELQTLRKGTYAEQCSDLADRLTGELIQSGRSELAARIKTEPQNNSRSAHPNSAIA